MSITQVTTTGIADDALTASKIATGAVGTTEIANDAVTSAKIAAGAVGTTEIASGVTITGTLNGNASSVTNGVYTTNFPNSFANSGYQTFPGGFTIQWGISGRLGQSTQTQTFATPFTTAVFAVIATPITSSPPAGDKRDHWAVDSFTLNNFRLVSWFEGPTVAYNWIAIGY
jgi:hypothetical protein